MKIILKIFPQKMLVWGKSTILNPKMTHPHNSGLTLTIFFLDFAQWMGLIVHRSYINGLSKKKNWGGQMGHLGSRMSHPASQFWIRRKDCFTILHNERVQERHGNYINGFSERSLIQSNLVILEQKWDGVFLTLNLLSGFFINFTQ